MSPSAPSSALAAPSGSSIALGGDHVGVRYRRAFADKQPGETESVLVRELEIDPSLLDFLKRIDDLPALADYVCARETGWSLALAPASLLDVVEKAMALNFSAAQRWAQLRARIAEELVAAGLSKSKPSTSSAAAPA